jgi:hypothetical protein
MDATDTYIFCSFIRPVLKTDTGIHLNMQIIKKHM